MVEDYFVGCTGLRFLDTLGLIVQWSLARKKEKFRTQETATSRLKMLNEAAKNFLTTLKNEMVFVFKGSFLLLWKLLLVGYSLVMWTLLSH